MYPTVPKLVGTIDRPSVFIYETSVFSNFTTFNQFQMFSEFKLTDLCSWFGDMLCCFVEPTFSDIESYCSSIADIIHMPEPGDAQ